MIVLFAVGWVLGLASASFGQVTAADHLLLTEFAVTPTDGEFFEIYNPTPSVIDLTNYYVSDFVFAGDPAQNYWRITDGALVPSGGFATDFCARFPEGATIAPGQSIVICLKDNFAFEDTWGAPADYEMVQDGLGDGVPSMVDPGPETVGVPLIQGDAGLSNSREVIVLFFWDGESDLVKDVDIVQWSNAGPDFVTVSPNKSGVRIDGPDADTIESTYQLDTTPAAQSLAANGQHLFGRTVTRTDYREGTETRTAGNGITGHNETSENYAATWLMDTQPSIGSPGDYGPPALLRGTAEAVDRVDLFFSRDLDPATAEDQGNYSALAILTPGGAVTQFPVAVREAVLQDDRRTVRLTTSDLSPQVLYRISVKKLRSENLQDEVVQGTETLVYGYNPSRQLVLDVPPRPFVPHLDGAMEIRYLAPQGEPILLRVFDNRGRELFVLADEVSPAGGQRTLSWNGRDHLRQRLPAGMYYLHLSSPASGDNAVAPIVVGVASEEAIR